MFLQEYYDLNTTPEIYGPQITGSYGRGNIAQLQEDTLSYSQLCKIRWRTARSTPHATFQPAKRKVCGLPSCIALLPHNQLKIYNGNFTPFSVSYSFKARQLLYIPPAYTTRVELWACFIGEINIHYSVHVIICFCIHDGDGFPSPKF